MQPHSTHCIWQKQIAYLNSQISPGIMTDINFFFIRVISVTCEHLETHCMQDTETHWKTWANQNQVRVSEFPSEKKETSTLKKDYLEKEVK